MRLPFSAKRRRRRSQCLKRPERRKKIKMRTLISKMKKVPQQSGEEED
jgi:hypothetical protein